MVPFSRRDFFHIGLALTLFQGLSGFGSAGPVPCTTTRKATPSAPAADFRAKSPERRSLMEPGLTGEPITLTGLVIGLTCGNIKGAVVDIWQADAAGVADPQGFRLRGHQVTDKDGRYTFTTIIPGGVRGLARTINARVAVPGRPPFVTQLFFPDDPLNAKHPAFKAELLLQVTGERGQRTASFDFILDM